MLEIEQRFTEKQSDYYSKGGSGKNNKTAKKGGKQFGLNVADVMAFPKLGGN